jgi:hypothetical protein
VEWCVEVLRRECRWYEGCANVLVDEVDVSFDGNTIYTTKCMVIFPCGWTLKFSTFLGDRSDIELRASASGLR